MPHRDDHHVTDYARDAYGDVVAEADGRGVVTTTELNALRQPFRRCSRRPSPSGSWSN